MILHTDECQTKPQLSTAERLLLGLPVTVPDASSGDGIVRTYEQCCEWAEAYDCDVKVANDWQLFVDIDSAADGARFKAVCYLLKLVFPVTSPMLRFTVTPSKQGLPHQHIVIDLPGPLPLLARIALQAALGSDPTREIISVARALKQEDNVVVFFEKREHGEDK